LNNISRNISSQGWCDNIAAGRGFGPARYCGYHTGSGGAMSDQGNKVKSKYPTVLSIRFTVQLRYFLSRLHLMMEHQKISTSLDQIAHDGAYLVVKIWFLKV
jgi:hypothetical protein